MGVIQNAINQMIGTAGIVGRLSPGYETKQELYKLGKEEKIIGKQAESATLHGEEAKDLSLVRNLGDIKKRQMELAEKKFQLDPSEESFQQSVKAQQSYRRFNEFESLLYEKQDQANLEAAQKSEAKQKTKRNFMNYLKNIEIQGGGKVGDLPQPMQKKIAAQYTKAERNKLMNTMDKEKTNDNK